MKKIISLFQRNYDGDRLVRNEIVRGAEWVIDGEGTATKKFDGTCCMINNNILYKRYDAKKGKTPPEGFISAQEPDENTGHWPGWLEVNKDDSSDKYHWEGFNYTKDQKWHRTLENGTYELTGPKINGNKERPDGKEFAQHQLIKHGSYVLLKNPRSFDQIKDFLKNENQEGGYFEGIVWHHQDGRMVKIKYKDFFK